MNKEKKYFVVYNYSTKYGAEGIGRITIVCGPIIGMEAIEKIEQHIIEKYKFDTVFINNWRPFEEE